MLANLADLQPFMSQTGPVPSSDILTLKNINEVRLRQRRGTVSPDSAAARFTAGRLFISRCSKSGGLSALETNRKRFARSEPYRFCPDRTPTVLAASRRIVK